MQVRRAEAADIDGLARIWYDGWQDAHASILPAALARLRTFESFKKRLQAALPDVRVVGSPGAPVGFCIVRRDELDQLYVLATARGTGAAAALVDDAERRLRNGGVETAWLACAIGNDRAARFYEKCGWRCVGTMEHDAETEEGPFRVRAWRFEKGLDPVVSHQ